MNRLAAIADRPFFWEAAIFISALAALLLNLAGLRAGITVAIPHLLYIPVVIAAYRYPRLGAIVAAFVGAVYILMVVVVVGIVPERMYEAVARTMVLVIIGWLIGMLTLRLREQENLYQGLFEHSESGSILVAEGGTGRTIEAVNWKGADLLHRKNRDLAGAPLETIWEKEREQEFFHRLAKEGALYAVETAFLRPDHRPATVLVSAAPLPEKRTILTFVDITDRALARQALTTANDKLSLMASISADHIRFTVDQILETADEADTRSRDAVQGAAIDRIRTLAWKIARLLFLSGTYKDLGTSPPVWMSIRQIFGTSRLVPETGAVSIRIWTDRLEIYADPLFSDVLIHLVENSLRHGGTTRNIVVTYHETADGLALSVRDDGNGIPAEKREHLFEYDAGGQAGIGLFICRQIVEVTGMTLREAGTEGDGAWFVIQVPPGRYRIEGTGDDAPPLPLTEAPAPYPARYGTDVTVRELIAAEFPVADALWTDYHNTKGDPRIDRIFAAFREGEAVALARCRSHPDGHEVDGVFTPAAHRGHGYADAAVRSLVEACGADILFMHSVLNLGRFYARFGFVPIDEKELPASIRGRFAWAEGQMEGANVLPMKRVPPSRTAAGAAARPP